MRPRVSILLVLCTAAATATAAVPPLPSVLPDTAQDRVRTQLAIQQAQAQASMAASQARLQAQLNANQARLEGQVAAQEQAQLNAARQPIAASGGLAGLPLPVAVPMQGPSTPMGTLELAKLTPQLGRYFGTDHGVLVVRAPAHGVLKLQDGDVILAIGGRIPSSSSQAIRILTSYDPGQKIELSILREHHRINITATMPGPPGGP